MIAAAAAVALTAGVGLALFQPWKLWTHSYVDEALPGVSASSDGAGGSAAPGRPAGPAARSPAPTAPTGTPVVVRAGDFRSGEHRTTGRALLVRLPDGHYLVRLEHLDTSDGPDVHVVLAATAAGSRSVGDHLRLGRLKATSGNQNYVVPAGTDLSRFRSVAVWCRRFAAVFGNAPLDPA